MLILMKYHQCQLCQGCVWRNSLCSGGWWINECHLIKSWWIRKAVRRIGRSWNTLLVNKAVKSSPMDPAEIYVCILRNLLASDMSLAKTRESHLQHYAAYFTNKISCMLSIHLTFIFLAFTFDGRLHKQSRHVPFGFYYWWCGKMAAKMD